MKQSRNKEIFLDEVCELIKAKNLHKQIKSELNDHIEDQMEAYIANGVDEEQALLKSIKDMGDPVLVGEQLNEAHKPLVEWSVLITTALFLLISGVMQYIFSIAQPISNNGHAIFFGRFLLYAPIGIVIFTSAYFFDYTILKKSPWLLYISYFLFMRIIFIISPLVNGAVYYGDFASLIFIPIFSGLVYRLSNMRYLGILLSGVVCMPPIIITLLIPSISNSLIIIISCLVILTSAIRRGLFRCSTKVGLGLVYIPTMLSAVFGFFLLLAQSPYRLQSLLSLFTLHPEPYGEGYRIAIAREIIRNARPFGSILVRKKPLEAILPSWNGEFSFAFLIGKLGYIPAALVIALVLFLLYRLFKISLGQTNILGRLVSLGCVSILLLQFVCSIFFNLGFYSLIIQTPPFLAYGFFSLAFTMWVLGLILSVYRSSNIVDNTLPSPMMKNNLIYIDGGKLIIDFSSIAFKR